MLKNKLKYISLSKPKDFFEENDWDFDVFILTIMALVINMIGFSQMYEEHNLQGNMLDYLYYSIRVFVFDLQTPAIDTQIPFTLEIGRWLAAAATVMIILITLRNVFSDKKALWQRGDKHIVVAGAGEKGKTLILDWIEEMKKKPEDQKLIVCIEKDKNNPNIDILKDKGVVFIFGKAQEEKVLLKAKIDKAEYFVTMTDQDTTNMEIISKVTNMQTIMDRKEKLKTYVHLLHSEFYDFFMAKTFDQDTTKVDIKVFNLFSNSARMLFRERTLGDNVFQTTAEIKEPTKKVKIAILGFGKLAENVFVHALHLGHFYNQTPIEITIVYDKDKNENTNLEDEFIKQYDIGIDKKDKEKEEVSNSRFTEYWNVKFIDDGKFVDEDINLYTQIIVAHEDEFESLSNLMKILRRYNDTILENEIDIAIYSNSFENTAKIIKNDQNKIYKDENTVFKHVRTFGELNQTCSYDMVINESLDRMAILNNKHYNELHGYDDKNKSAKQEWESLSMFLKDSNRYLIEHNDIKKHFIDKFIENRAKPISDYENLKNSIATKYLLENERDKINWDQMGLKDHDYGNKLTEKEIVTLGKVEHMRWNAFHILNGWKKLEIAEDETNKIKKDPVRKLHPCIVSWEELDTVSKNHNHDYKSDDIETIMRIPSLERVY